MSNNSLEGANGDSLSKLNAEAIYTEYLQGRTSESQVDQVMARLAEAGLIQRESKNSEQVDEEFMDVEVLNSVYTQYRKIRTPANRSDVDAVMERLSAEPVNEPSMEKERRNTASKAPSIAQQIFGRPSLVLRNKITWFRFKNQETTLFPRIVIPLAALAITAVALVPLILNTSDTSPGATVGERVAYMPPQSLIDGAAVESQVINLDPGIAMGLSGGSNAQGNVFALGQRLLEATMLAKNSSGQSVANSIVAIRLENLASSFDSDGLQLAINDLASSLLNVPADIELLIVDIQKVRSIAINDSQNVAFAWIGFGEATEALAMANRLNRIGSTSGSNASIILAETLDSFNAMRFIGTLPDLTEQTTTVLRDLAEISGTDLFDPVRLRQVDVLTQKLLLSVI